MTRSERFGQSGKAGVVTEGGVSEMTLADRLNQLENKLRSLIFSQSSQQAAQTSAVY